jgi:hypothetical protein
MRIETALVFFSATFLAVVAGIYWFTSYEDAGTTTLALGATAYGMLAGFYFVQARRLTRRRQRRPEDSPDATVPDSPVAIGYFPAASVWPAAMGLGIAVIALGLVFGYWFLVVGTILLVGGIIGYAVEAQARP